MSKFLTKKGKRAGATLMEIIIVLVITVSATSGAIAFYSHYLDGQAQVSAAQQMREVSSAAHEYVQERYSRIYGDLQPTGVREITNDIQYFGRQLRDYQNNYQQEYRAFVRARTTPEPGMDLLVVTDSGENIPLKQASQIARMLGATGGFTRETGAVVSDSGGFEINLQAVYGIPNESGRLVSYIPLTHAKGNDADMLFRNSIAGRSNLNQMNTDLDMGMNDMTGVDEYQGDHLMASDALHSPRFQGGSEPAFNSAGTRIRTDINQIETRNANTHYLRTGPNSSPSDTVTGALTASGDGQIDGTTRTRTIYTYGSDVDLRQAGGAPGGSVSTQDLESSGIMFVEPYSSGGRMIQPAVTERAICPKAGLLGRTTTSPSVFMLCKESDLGGLRWESVLKGDGSSYFGFNDDIVNGKPEGHWANNFLVIHRPFHGSGQSWIKKTLPGKWGACFISSARITKEGTAWPHPSKPSWPSWMPQPSSGKRDKLYYTGKAMYQNDLHPYKQLYPSVPNQGGMIGYEPESSSHCLVMRESEDTWSLELAVVMNNLTEHWCHAACLR